MRQRTTKAPSSATAKAPPDWRLCHIGQASDAADRTLAGPQSPGVGFSLNMYQTESPRLHPGHGMAGEAHEPIPGSDAAG
ncbi:hypothetical protein HJFPF1_03187 [Paramyrothecium foliicola]|nr:hypothetical protein HJFPF1_03187 [Paramyrothecium foliicola]